ncbi:hypothetical protein [Pleurocapsa sp. PCC 7319]|nr:hypothetical protein [Pleurocapsa sp. PCC 7319]
MDNFFLILNNLISLYLQNLNYIFKQTLLELGNTAHVEKQKDRAGY